RYPLHACSRRSSPLYPTIDHLVAWPASAGLAASSETLVRVAHTRGVPLRIDEMNVTPCPQRAHEVRSFAAARWALDVLFELRAPAASGSATLEGLLAPSIASKQGITLGGQTFGSVTTTGRLAGDRKKDRVSVRAGRYVFSVPAYSAAMLTLG